MRWYVTFPASDIVRRDCYAVIEGMSESTARSAAIAAYGRSGFAQLDDDPAVLKIDERRLSRIEFGE